MRKIIELAKFIICYIASAVGAFLFFSLISKSFTIESSKLFEMPIYILGITVLSNLIFLYIYKKDVKRIISEIKESKLTLKDFFKLFLGTIISVGVMLFLGCILPKPENKQLAVDMVQSFPIYGLLLAVVIAPIFEEILFRGILLKKTSILISSITFGLFHIGNLTDNLIVMFTVPFITFLFGLYLGKLYEKYNSILPCIITHMGFNLISSSLILLRP